MKSQFILLMATLSVLMSLGNCQINSMMQTLDKAGNIVFDLSIKYEQLELSPEMIIAELIDMFDSLNKTHHRMEYDFDFSMEELFAIFEKLNKSSDRITTIKACIQKIENYFAKYYDVMTDMKLKKSSYLSTVDQFFNSIILEYEKDKFDLLNVMNIAVLGEQSKETGIRLQMSLFQLMGDYIKVGTQQDCDPDKLTQRHIQNFFRLIADQEYVARSLIISALKYFTITKKDNYHSEIKYQIKKTRSRITQYTSETYEAMLDTAKNIYACDNGNYIRNKTYIELVGLPQGYLMDPEGQILETSECYVEQSTGNICTTVNPECFLSLCSEEHGKLKNCTSFTAQELKLCPSPDKKKRYSWMHSSSGNFPEYSGSEQPCPFRVKEIKKKENSEFCFCDCERTKWQPGDIRSISLMWTEADYASNRVMTNLKFEEKNGMIHLRAQHGRILSGGRIDQSSLSWIDVPNAIPKPTDSDEPDYILYAKDKHPEARWYDGSEFLYISTNLTLNLDVISAPKGSIIIGVALKSNFDLGSNSIELIMASMEYDYKTGELDRGNKFISSTTLMNDSQRTPVYLGSPDSPLNNNNNGKKKDIILSSGFRTIQFQRTSMEKDLGQSIVPFFDIRPLNPTPAVPLSGIGLYHYGCHGCGGFISPILIPLDLSHGFYLDLRRLYDFQETF